MSEEFCTNAENTHGIIFIRPKKIAVFPLTLPTLIFSADPAVFIPILKEKNIFIPTHP